jgi:hypothetical protein
MSETVIFDIGIIVTYILLGLAVLSCGSLCHIPADLPTSEKPKTGSSDWVFFCDPFCILSYGYQ